MFDLPALFRTGDTSTVIKEWHKERDSVYM